MKQNTKDWMQHTTAVVLIASAIVMGFLSFLTTEDIGAGPLTYIGEALSAALALFGVAAYFGNQLSSFKTEIRREMMNIREEEERNRHFGGHRVAEHQEEEENKCTSSFEE